jgi:pimeloyl-ACP methyl ester carboxylesterase
MLTRGHRLEVGRVSRIITTKRRLKIGLALLAGLAVAWFAASLWAARHFTSRRRPAFAEPLPEIGWAKVENQRLRTRDGQEIGTWFFAGAEDRPAIVLLHETGGCRSAALERAHKLCAARYPILAVSLRAHGDSSGDVSDFGYGARHDVLAAVEWLERRRPGKGIVLFGSSLGAAAAVFAAAELGNRVGGYILECPYRDLPTAVRNRTRMYLPWGVEWVAYQGLRLAAPLVLADVEKISPLAEISHIPPPVPVLILAGDQDRHAPLEDAQALWERVRGHGRLVVVAGAGHMSLDRSDPALFWQSVLSFLDQARGQSAAPKAVGRAGMGRTAVEPVLDRPFRRSRVWLSTSAPGPLAWWRRR